MHSTYKMYVPEDRYYMNKKKLEEKSEMFGMKICPVNMHGQPSPVGKNSTNLENTVEGIAARFK